MASIYRLLGGSCQVAPGRAQVAAELGLQQSPSQGPQVGHVQWAALDQAEAPPRVTYDDDTPKGQTEQAQEPY